MTSTANPPARTKVHVRELTGDEQMLLAAARLVASRAQPYLSSAIFAMVPRAAEGLGTFGVDRRWRLYVDPEVLRSWSATECAAVLLHEVGHLVRDHAARGDRIGVYDPEHHHRWNIAGDLAINDDLIADGAHLPGRPVTPRALGLEPGLAEEEYYGLLSPSTVERDDGPGPELPGRPGAPAAGSQGRGADADGGPARTDGRPTATTSDCGSGADGRTRPWELADDHDGARGLPATAAAAIRIQVAEAIRTAGTAPQGWRRWADDGSTGRRDWRRVLHAAITRPRTWRAGQRDRTWHRPDRREDAHPGLILPGTRSPRFEIAVIIDTSGSVTDAEVGAALAEVAAVQRQCGVRELWAITCDAKPSTPRRVRRPSAIELVGGGGTDLRPAIALLPTLRPQPDVAIVITDGWTPWPESAPKGTALVVATTDRHCPVPGTTTVPIHGAGG